MVVQCCVCHRVRQSEGWVEVTPPCGHTEHVSHGYCPHCAERAMEEIRAFHAPHEPSLFAGLAVNL